MKTATVKELSVEAFALYGSYSNMLDPKGPYIGGGVIEFYRDMVIAPIPGENVGLSITKVYPRDKVVNVAEYHDHTGEAMLPLDGDVLIHVAPATGHDVVPYDQFEIFRVPQGTLVALRPGVWHHGPFTLTDKPVNNLIVLPERTYANDCVVVNFPEEEYIEIK